MGSERRRACPPGNSTPSTSDVHIARSGMVTGPSGCSTWRSSPRTRHPNRSYSGTRSGQQNNSPNWMPRLRACSIAAVTTRRANPCPLESGAATTPPRPATCRRAAPTESGTRTNPACATRRPCRLTPKCTSLSSHVRSVSATPLGSTTPPLTSSRSVLVYRASRIAEGDMETILAGRPCLSQPPLVLLCPKRNSLPCFGGRPPWGGEIHGTGTGLRVTRSVRIHRRTSTGSPSSR